MASSSDHTLRVTTADVDWWFARLHELNGDQREAARKRGRTPAHRLSNRLSIGLILMPAALSLALGLGAWIVGSRWLAGASIIMLALCYLGILAYFFAALWIHRQSARRLVSNPFAVLVDNARFTADVDRPYLSLFAEQSPDALRYVLMEVRAEKTFFERRLGLLVGSIERIGLLPGVLAIAVLLARLGADQPEWIYAIAYATPILYMVAVMSHVLLMRLSRIVELLEMLLDRSEHEHTARRHDP